VTCGGSSRTAPARVALGVARGEFRNPGMGTSAVGSRYQRTGEGTADREDSVRAAVNSRVCELAIALE
jgi:hypothetical protein